MKKLLLLAMAAGIVSTSASAQVAGGNVHLTKVDFKKELTRGTEVEQGPVRATSIVRATPRPLTLRHTPKNPSVATVGKVNISTTANIYGSLISEGGLVSYEPTLHILGYTDRKTLSSLGGTTNSGTIQTRSSKDYGVTWDTTLIDFPNAVAVTRYPNGTIVNPPGNTIADSAYAVAAGAILNGTTWDGGSFGSIQLKGAYPNVLELANSAGATQFQTMPRLGMCSGTNGNAYVLGSDYDINNTTNPYMDGFVVNRAVWNATTHTFDWDTHLIYHAFSHSNVDGSQNFSSLGNMAFSADGVTGYIVTIGRDSICDHRSPMPIIYRTTDAGATWSLYTKDNFSPLFANIFPANPLTPSDGARPFYSAANGYSCVVDANNKLHLLCEVDQAATDNQDPTNTVDSLNFVNVTNALFDTYETASGQWVAVLVGRIWTAAPGTSTATTNPNDLGWTVNWDARAQISRSADGTKIAYVWEDTDPAISTLNEYPNLVGSALDLTMGMYSDTTNFTVGTAYEANNYWHYCGKQGWQDQASGDFVVPTETAVALNAGGIDTDPWMHQYVSGIQFPAAGYTHAVATGVALSTTCAPLGINEIPVASNTSSIYPNPASDKAVITVDMNNTSLVTVKLTNTLGQVVQSMDLGNVAAGKHSFSMDVNTVPSGFYLVSITMGSKVITQKLNVAH